MTHKFVPTHLKNHIVEQDYDRYTAIDHAAWRFIMRISSEFFKKHAHESYREGLKKTGITINRIPRIEEMDEKLSQFGWGAVCVRGFIPPQAFMEFQSLGILPIAADMRTLEHLTYTPAPDIVHEAAGHAPILADPDYAAYIKKYGAIASKAIASKEDMVLYNAIRDLSDIKENPASPEKEIQQSEKNLHVAVESISFVSEAAEMARMNWWTVEYGMVGNMENPKIYGAGLLSSVGESFNCLKPAVKKINFDINNIKYSYDITEQQPQLFVVPDFHKLSTVLDEVAETMAFSCGGLVGLEKAVQAETVNTVELDSSLQISGVLDNYTVHNDETIYLQFKGPAQLSSQGKQLDGHGGDYHSEGYGTPLGKINGFGKPLGDFSEKELENYGLRKGNSVSLLFESGVSIEGKLTGILFENSRPIILTFTGCTVKKGDQIFFNPEWGRFDLACGERINSVFGGPADFDQYAEFMESPEPRKEIMAAKKALLEKDRKLNDLYTQVRKIRENGRPQKGELLTILQQLNKEYSNDWLLAMEILEIDSLENETLQGGRNKLETLSREDTDLGNAIRRGLNLISAIPAQSTAE